MSEKVRFPRAAAMAAARELCHAIWDACERQADGVPFLKVCGSLRRGRADVGDVELVYIPRVVATPEPQDLLGDTGKMVPVNQVDLVLNEWLKDGRLERRLNKLGRPAWGELNKLAVHGASRVPVDLFTSSRKGWWSYVVCRTGSAESNTRIASAAIEKGWKWHMVDGYFSDALGRRHWIESEQDVFRLVGLPYREPKDR